MMRVILVLILFFLFCAISFPINWEESLKKLETEKGPFFLLLMNPSTGKILFSYHGEKLSQKYSIGSLIKPFTFLAVSRTKTIDREKMYLCKGFKEYSQDKICWLAPGHGNIGLVEAFAHSCNSYFYDQIVKGSLIREEFLKVLNDFSMDYSFKPYGLTDEDFFRSAIGLDGYLLVTPVSILRAYNSLFNGGFLFDEKGNISGNVKCSDENVEIIRQGMRGSYLYGTSTAVYKKTGLEDAAAKTGTGMGGENGINTKKTAGWMILFYPSEKPMVSILVLVENGRGGKEAAEITAQILKILNF